MSERGDSKGKRQREQERQENRGQRQGSGGLTLKQWDHQLIWSWRTSATFGMRLYSRFRRASRKKSSRVLARGIWATLKKKTRGARSISPVGLNPALSRMQAFICPPCYREKLAHSSRSISTLAGTPDVPAVPSQLGRRDGLSPHSSSSASCSLCMTPYRNSLLT